MIEFLFGGWLSSAIISFFIFGIGLFITKPYIDYKICCYKIKNIKLSEEYSFITIHNLLRKCSILKPDCFMSYEKFCKDIGISKKIK